MLLLALPASLSVAAGFQEQLEVKGDELVLDNMIGHITVGGHSGSEFKVTIDVKGSDASRDRIRIDTDSDDAVRIVFPVNKQRRYVYPEMKGNSTSFTLEKSDRGWMSSVLGDLMGKRIKVSKNGTGLEVWADVEILVPRGASLTVRHGVGEIDAGDVDGELELATHSGGVEVDGVRGDLLVDTGSGTVVAASIDGDVSIDTGSGRVELNGADGGSIHIDTGSGAVRINDIATRKLHVDTGSGSVRASHVETDSANIDTGSGSVRLELDRMGSGSFRIDTGSGGITLALPDDASAEIEADTGSGGIDVEFDGAMLKRHDRDNVLLTIGGGAASVQLDTGSGGIRITRSE
ncbi:MAG: DUF4097 domain-containing protein [bacterium]|nr:DUF4097 domain-containing protein [bacterium]